MNAETSALRPAPKFAPYGTSPLGPMLKWCLSPWEQASAHDPGDGCPHPGIRV
jgi:hypothetical protein